MTRTADLFYGDAGLDRTEFGLLALLTADEREQLRRDFLQQCIEEAGEMIEDAAP